MKPEEVTSIERLKGERPDLYQLYQEHLAYERRLDQLNTLSFLLPEEETERKRLRKLKLQGMDQMAAILRECEATT